MDLETELLVADATEQAFSFVAKKLGIAHAEKDTTGEALAFWVFKQDGEYHSIGINHVNFSRAVIQLLHAVDDLAKEGRLNDITLCSIEEAENYVRLLKEKKSGGQNA